MKFCLVSHSPSGLVSPSAGGAERQVGLLARSLADRGHDVVLVVAGLTGGERRAHGVRMRSGWDPRKGVPLLRSAYRYPRLYRVMLEEQADVYYARGGSYYTFLVVQAARAAGGASILAIASDRDLHASSGKVLFAVPSAALSSLIGPMVHAAFRRLALERADWVAVQNREQVTSCERLGLRHAIVPNIVAAPPSELPGLTPERDVIWAGNVLATRRSKGLTELARLAQMLPDVTFTVAGAMWSDAETVGLLRRLPNVQLTGLISHVATQRLIALHRLVINTSPSEGFSNVMLEGWSLGRPSVTLAVNPSGLLDGDDLGICAGNDLEAMAAAIVALLEEPESRGRMGERARRYVETTHAAGHVCEIVEGLAASP